MRTLEDIGADVVSQDNRCTANPIFAVQQKIRDYGYDPQWDGRHIWIRSDEGYEVTDSEEIRELEAEYEETGEDPEMYHRTGYVDRWEFVTACFTEQGCKDYLEINGHNLKEPRIYAYGGFRNAEWETIRRGLISFVEPVGA